MSRGFTLIEMMVAVAVFSLLVAAGSSAFVSSIKAQRQSLATQEVLDQTSYLMEYVSKALRMAKKDITGMCTETAKINYLFKDQCLKFVNYHGECQRFCLEGSRLKDENDNFLTSDNLTVVSFLVGLLGQEQPPLDYRQPSVAVFLEIQGREGANIKIQTTISQRNPDVQK